MKKLVCIDYLKHPDLDMTQAVLESDGGFYVSGKELPLEQLAGAQILSVRRLGAGLLQLELEVDTGGGEDDRPEPGEEDHDPPNLWLRAGYLWSMAKKTPPGDDQTFLLRSARSLVAFARKLAGGGS